MSQLVRMDRTGHTTLAEWSVEDPESVEAAVRAQGQPAATGIDGVKSLAVAAAVREAAEAGTRVTINYGGMK